MSNFVYGYIETDGDIQQVKSAVDEIAAKFPTGIYEIAVDGLNNFPAGYLPKDATRVLPFEISDWKDKGVAQHLINGIDYAPEADIGLPVMAEDRLDLLLRFLEEVVSLDGVTKVLVTMNDMAQVDEVVSTTSENFREVVIKDFDDAAPPDILYIIDKQ